MALLIISILILLLVALAGQFPLAQRHPALTRPVQARLTQFVVGRGPRRAKISALMARNWALTAAKRPNTRSCGNRRRHARHQHAYRIR